ncbi:MAG: hypothetical protein J0M09_11520 [Xanthomonadales bacterium]|nr:hypothetical protein [Xanthomonadales bacterium]
MEYSEFVAVIGDRKTPELKDFERVSIFANTADKDMLWMALGNGGIHPIYQALVVQALHRRLIEALEREQAQQRKLEEDARHEAVKDPPPRKRSR